MPDTGQWGSTTTGQWRLKPGYGNLLGQLDDMSFGLGPGKIAKQNYKALNRGDDVSSLGMFNSINQEGAAERQNINEDYMTGGNALVAGMGGDQANVLQRLKEDALGQSRQRQSMATASAIPQLQSNLAGTWQNSINSANQAELAKYGQMGNLLGQGQYEKPKGFNWGSFLGNLGGAAASAFI